MNKKGLTYVLLLGFTFLLSIIIYGKLLYIAPHLAISASLLAYAFTFLFTARLNEETNINIVKSLISQTYEQIK